jgi:hypothetical protein
MQKASKHNNDDDDEYDYDCSGGNDDDDDDNNNNVSQFYLKMCFKLALPVCCHTLNGSVTNSSFK